MELMSLLLTPEMQDPFPPSHAVPLKFCKPSRMVILLMLPFELSLIDY